MALAVVALINIIIPSVILVLLVQLWTLFALPVAVRVYAIRAQAGRARQVPSVYVIAISIIILELHPAQLAPH